MDWKPQLPATLYRFGGTRSRAGAGFPSEEIATGALSKMVRLALSDPDGEIWRYSIGISGEKVIGHEINEVANTLPIDDRMEFVKSRYTP